MLFVGGEYRPESRALVPLICTVGRVYRPLGGWSVTACSCIAIVGSYSAVGVSMMCRGSQFTDWFLRIGCGIFWSFGTLLSSTLMAEDLSYRYVEVNGVFGESGGEDSTGLAFDVSYELGDVLFATAGLRRSDVDTEPESDGEFYRLGLGVRRGVTESLDVLFMAHYGRLDVSAPAPSGGTHNILDETGALIDLGIRGQIGTAAEYSLLATFVDLADRGWGYRAGGRFQLGESPYSLGLHYSGFENDWDQFELGVRYQFD